MKRIILSALLALAPCAFAQGKAPLEPPGTLGQVQAIPAGTDVPLRVGEGGACLMSGPTCMLLFNETADLETRLDEAIVEREKAEKGVVVAAVITGAVGVVVGAIAAGVIVAAVKK